MNSEPPVVLAIGLDKTLQEAARLWANMYNGEVRIAHSGRDALRYLATTAQTHLLVLVGDQVVDMPATTVTCSARDLLGPRADIVAVVPDMEERQVRRLQRCGVSLCVASPRQILHPSAPIFAPMAKRPAA